MFDQALALELCLPLAVYLRLLFIPKIGRNGAGQPLIITRPRILPHRSNGVENQDWPGKRRFQAEAIHLQHW